ncbi:DUF423 domain-containing protein [Billgrantia gudaonensis]|uniref:Uncharacterized membrane protein YgdD, TMEM256/DUF423 family n=1 Tax=Billgrantia gudaonensis TaxID=376427 RepID=A0A1G8YE77_9GAMM|nr:DUF423 domain-containing protein [Halomonas gudaonensis]SDK00963.1 Uncharacterized membrane protein YgdD, TMEM256/DUF423 family [Halomonas gudaonensis]
MHDRPWWSLTALSGALTVIAGAFGAHALEGQLAPRLAAAFETGVRYQAWHTLAMLAVLAWRANLPLAGQRLVLLLWTVGIGLFSGSLYVLALAGGRGGLVLITPLGGLALIGGWLALAVCALRGRRDQSESGRT